MTKKDNTEKRKYARLELTSKINFKLLEPEMNRIPKEQFSAVGENIGVKGLKFFSDKKMPAGKIIVLEILLPGEKKPLYVQAEVRWCHAVKTKKRAGGKYEIGISFLTIEKEHILMLLKYVCGDLQADEQKTHENKKTGHTKRKA